MTLHLFCAVIIINGCEQIEFHQQLQLSTSHIHHHREYCNNAQRSVIQSKTYLKCHQHSMRNVKLLLMLDQARLATGGVPKPLELITRGCIVHCPCLLQKPTECSLTGVWGPLPCISDSSLLCSSCAQGHTLRGSSYSATAECTCC